jgi:lysozyme
MDDLSALRARIIEHEGLKLFPYKDTVGKWTIGVGRNLSDRGISHDEAMYLLNNDIQESIQELKHYDWFNNLDEVRQGVLIELHFNIGLTSLLKFKNMIACLEKKYYLNAAKALENSLWSRQVGKIRSEDMADRLISGSY